MSLHDLQTKAGKILVDRSPLLLSGLALSGLVSTVVATSQATLKAADIWRDQDRSFDRKRDRNWEIVKVTWPLFVPPLFYGAFTATCIVMSHKVSNRRAAAMASAFSLSERAFEEYRAKVVERLGEGKDVAVRDAVAQDRVTSNPASEREVIVTGTGEVMCYDSFSGRYFMSSMESLKKAQNDLNYRLLHDNYASLTDFYNLIGLSKTGISDDVGWDNGKLLELEFSTVLSEDQKPCISIGFRVEPVRNYYKIGY